MNVIEENNVPTSSVLIARNNVSCMMRDTLSVSVCMCVCECECVCVSVCVCVCVCVCAH